MIEESNYPTLKENYTGLMAEIQTIQTLEDYKKKLFLLENA